MNINIPRRWGAALPRARSIAWFVTLGAICSLSACATEDDDPSSAPTTTPGDGSVTDAADTTDATTTTTPPTTTIVPPTTTPGTTTPPPTTSESATTTSTTSPETIGLGTATQNERGGIGFVLPPGRYTSDRLSVPVEVRIDEQMEMINFPGHVSFAPNGATERRPDGLFISSFAGIVPASDMATPSPGRTVPERFDPIPESMDDWFEGEPRVNVTDRGTSTVADAPAPWWDLSVDASAGETFSCLFGNCVTFMVDANIGPSNIGDGEWRFRLWHLTAFTEEATFAFLESSTPTWEATLEMAEQILDSLTLIAPEPAP